MDHKMFKNLIWEYYRSNKRVLPWRENIVPYHVVLTEIMLQQTQVPRVLIKFPQFISAFPTFKALAEAPMSAVLQEWQGMGYNRRGKYLKEIATIIHSQHNNIVPSDPDILDAMPGIGWATARSIVTFTYNKPEIFIETNIRRVFIHHFFHDKSGVEDRELLPLVEDTVDHQNPREWYYALMDYGTDLAKKVPNPNRKSKHYVKQSAFEGSKRQIRGAILKELLKNTEQSREEFYEHLAYEKERINVVLEDLKKEGFVMEQNGNYKINE